MSKAIEGGIIKRIIYERELPFMVIEGKSCGAKVYLNPRVIRIADEYRDNLINMTILSMEGDFSPQNRDLFFPSRVVLKGECAELDFKLLLG